MNKFVACTALGILGIFCADEVKGQARVTPGHKGAAHIGGGRTVVPQAAVVRQVGVVNNGHVNQAARQVGVPINGFVNQAAHIHNPGNIYSNGYYNPGYVRPYAYVTTNSPGYSYPGYGNPYGLNNYGPGYNYGYTFSILNGPVYPSNFNGGLLNSSIRLYPPGTGLVLGVVNGSSATVASTAANKDGKATVQIIAPAPDAEVMLDDFTTTATGRDRTFHTPVLEAGYRYGYSVTAVWIKDGEQLREVRTVDVFPGQISVVDFTRPAVPELVAVAPEKVDSANP